MEKEETEFLCESARGSDFVPFPFPHSQTPIPPFSPSDEWQSWTFSPTWWCHHDLISTRWSHTSCVAKKWTLADVWLCPLINLTFWPLTGGSTRPLPKIPMLWTSRFSLADKSQPDCTWNDAYVHPLLCLFLPRCPLYLNPAVTTCAPLLPDNLSTPLAAYYELDHSTLSGEPRLLPVITGAEEREGGGGGLSQVLSSGEYTSGNSPGFHTPQVL